MVKINVNADLSYEVIKKDSNNIKRDLYIEDSAGKQAYLWDNVPEDLSKDAEFLNEENYFTCLLRPKFR